MGLDWSDLKSLRRPARATSQNPAWEALSLAIIKARHQGATPASPPTRDASAGDPGLMAR